VNLGTSENGMHPQFREMLALLLTDDELRAFHDLEFSLDYPTREEQDAQRGPGNWDLVHTQADRCRRLGVPVTIIAVMMRTNFRRLGEILARPRLSACRPGIITARTIPRSKSGRLDAAPRRTAPIEGSSRGVVLNLVRLCGGRARIVHGDDATAVAGSGDDAILKTESVEGQLSKGSAPGVVGKHGIGGATRGRAS
jgi:hypothetical protein